MVRGPLRIASTLLLVAIVPLTVFALTDYRPFVVQESSAAEPQNSEPAPTANGLVQEVQELKKQLADLKASVPKSNSPQIVAAGTATFKRGAVQDNATNTRVVLDPEIAKGLGQDYIVLLTNRFPTEAYPFYVPYWKLATNGFDITLIDVTLAPESTVSYQFKAAKTFLVDWVVVKK